MSDASRQKRQRPADLSDSNLNTHNEKRKRSDSVDNVATAGASNGSVSLAMPANDAASAASSSATSGSNVASHKKDLWIFTEEELLNSPSRKCGITLEEETRYRQKAVDYMKRVGKKLRLRLYVEIATAIVFFNRFFTRQSFSDHGNYVVALACIFLATKVESGVKGRAADLIQVDYALRRKKKFESMKALISKLRTNKKPRQDDPAFKEFWEQKDQLHIYERILMMTLSFDVRVQHPYKSVMYQVKNIMDKAEKSSGSEHRRQQKAHTKQMAQYAWNFVNDSFKTTICLLFSATKIAAATVFLSFRLQTRRGGNVGVTEEGLLQMFAAKEISRHDIFAIRWIDE